MKLVKYAAVGAAALALGWFIGGVVVIVAAARLFEQADLDDDLGGFAPDQVLDRLRIARDKRLFEAFDRWDDVA